MTSQATLDSPAPPSASAPAAQAAKMSIHYPSGWPQAYAHYSIDGQGAGLLKRSSALRIIENYPQV